MVVLNDVQQTVTHNLLKRYIFTYIVNFPRERNEMKVKTGVLLLNVLSTLLHVKCAGE